MNNQDFIIKIKKRLLDIKNFAILFGMMLAINAGAQNFHTNSTDTTFFGNETDSDFDTKFVLFNDSTASFPMSWEVETATIETGWDYSVCDPSVCYAIGTSAGNFNLSTSTINRIMNLHYYPNGNTGQSTVTVKLWENVYPNDPIYLSWTGVVSTVGLETDIASYSLNVFPNPANGVIQVTYALDLDNKNNEIQLVDLSGKLVAKKIIIGKSGVIKFEDNLDSGVYFYSLVSDGIIISTQKVIVK